LAYIEDLAREHDIPSSTATSLIERLTCRARGGRGNRRLKEMRRRIAGADGGKGQT
jgi:hypothetical protein